MSSIQFSFPASGCAAKVKFKAFQEITPGAYLSSSWGYEQTNIDFYKVIEVKNGWAKVQQVENAIVGAPEGFSMACKVVPGVKASGNVIRRKIKGRYISVNSYSSASPWNGLPQIETHYA